MMLDEVKNDILDVLGKAIMFIKEEDAVSLSELSNHTIHNASIYQDEDSVTVAVLVYAVSKLVQRQPGKVNGEIVNCLRRACDFLSGDNIQGYHGEIKYLLGSISKKDDEMKLYIEHVIDNAKIKKGSKLYEHGLSVARACEILGISQWELMQYLGKTKITDRYADTGVIKRFKFAKRLFGL